VIKAGPGIVRVHLESNDPGLQLIGAEVSKLEPAADGTFQSLGPSTILCRAPCDTYVDARVGQFLHVESASTPASQLFQLYDQEGDVTLRVAPGNGPMAVSGAVFSVVGILGVLTGGVVLLVGGLSDSGSASDLMVGGGVATGISAAMLGGGIGLAVGGTTDVEIVPATAVPR
jgi:hypothetical protein